MSKVAFFKIFLGLTIIVSLAFAIALMPGSPTRNLLVNMLGMP